MDDPAYAMRLVGALLLGAALVAVAQFFLPVGAAQPWTAILLALLAALAARRVARRRSARAADAPTAIALVCAGAAPFFAVSPPAAGALGAILAALIARAHRGATPLSLLAVACFFVTARHATGAEMLRGSSVASELAFLIALAAYFVLLARTTTAGLAAGTARWADHALALQGAAIALAVLPLLDALRVTDAGIAALAVGATLGALFAVALRLRARPLALATGGLLAFAATSFAFLALGPALASIVLLLIGAAFVWRADHLPGRAS